jgi:hypothetical protein
VFNESLAENNRRCCRLHLSKDTRILSKKCPNKRRKVFIPLTTKDNDSSATRTPSPFWENDNYGPKQVAGSILNPKPDLLLPNTYNDPRALDYFECLEARLAVMPSSRFSPATLSFSAKPSNGHIGTSDPQQAVQWGNVVSIWPLGDELSYVWPRDRTEFFVPNSTIICDNFNDNLVINQDLAYALRSTREILFCSWFENSQDTTSSPFLVVSSEHDAVLLKALRKVNYGL